MTLENVLNTLREDVDVVRPFAERLLQRVREHHPHATMSDIELRLAVTERGFGGGPGSQETVAGAHKLLSDMVKESVSI